MRDERRERDKYGRASLREQLGSEIAALRRNPPLIWLLVALVGGWAILTVTRPQALAVTQLRTGDCVYIHAPDADTDTPGGRAIGSELGALGALYEQGAERSACDASHSHEVALAWILGDGLTASYPGQAALTVRERERCEAAFTAHVGRPSEGSTFALVIAVPTPTAWAASVRAAACLVARADGAFLSGSARGSGH